MMDILDNKHIHGKNLRDYTAKQRGAKRESFNHLMEEYSRYRERIEAVDSLTEDGIRELILLITMGRLHWDTPLWKSSFISFSRKKSSP